jgi:hypothetical protein
VFETLVEISRLTLDAIRASLGESSAVPPPAPVAPPRVAPGEEAAAPVKAQRARGPLDLGVEMEKLRALTAEGAKKPSTAVDVNRLVRDLVLSGGEASPAVEHKGSVELPADVLDGLAELRVHLGFDRNGREEIVRDAVRLALAPRRRLGRLRLRLDLELKGPE